MQPIGLAKISHINLQITYFLHCPFNFAMDFIMLSQEMLTDNNIFNLVQLNYSITSFGRNYTYIEKL